MRVYNIYAMDSTVVLELTLKEVRTLLKSIRSVKDQEPDLLTIGSQLFAISSMFREIEALP